MQKLLWMFSAVTFLVGSMSTSLKADDISLPPLVTPQLLYELQEHENLIILDIRGDDFSKGHISGAISAPYGLWRGPAENPGKLVSVSHLTDLLRSLGIHGGEALVITYQGKDATDFGAAARVYWTLKSVGIQNLAILNGGVNAWTKAGLELTQKVVSIVPSKINVTFSNRWLSTREDVEAIISGEKSAVLIDARTKPFFEGEKQHPAAAKPGTLPDAKLLPYHNWFTEGASEIMGSDAVNSLAAGSGYHEQMGEFVSFCNTGHWAATNWFALGELAKVDGVKLYPESMVGWSQAGLEMMNAPGFWDKVNDAF